MRDLLEKKYKKNVITFSFFFIIPHPQIQNIFAKILLEISINMVKWAKGPSRGACMSFQCKLYCESEDHYRHISSYIFGTPCPILILLKDTESRKTGAFE